MAIPSHQPDAPPTIVPIVTVSPSDPPTLAAYATAHWCRRDGLSADKQSVHWSTRSPPCQTETTEAPGVAKSDSLAFDIIADRCGRSSELSLCPTLMPGISTKRRVNIALT